jgi:hypothetical protein
MKLYKKDGMIATYRVDDTWEEFEDEYISTPIGERLRSEVETDKFKKELEEYNLSQLRTKRGQECFAIINRGSLWYETLNDEQKEELKTWYKDWLDVTETKIVPERPLWLK